MDPLTPGIVEVDPTDARVGPLIKAHLTLMRASSPACSVHAMEAGDLLSAGLADRMLAHLLAVARDKGLTRVSLETGSQEAFFPARQFYARHGFSTCPPFEGYTPDPNSVFMTLLL